eukprot:COSAG01_NODE_839_length_13190_cov_138.958368_12_plen_60_part_00
MRTAQHTDTASLMHLAAWLGLCCVLCCLCCVVWRGGVARSGVASRQETLVAPRGCLPHT